MGGFEKFFIWFISFLVFLLILFISYKVSYKLGIKKALYRTTYILLSVIFAFVLSPVLNRELFYIDLSGLNIELTYKDSTFYTLVDYIEEVIVHSDFLNDIYKYFPSLKDLFMDFPEVILTPITYVLLFVVFLVVWMPLYLYLSYKRKRRILYDRQEKKSHKVWAGIIGSVQCFFLISIVLTPLNGFNRVYHDAIEDTLDDEYHSLCEEISSLKKYSNICELIDIYDSTIFADIGGKGTLSNYVFDSLTRISYEGENTSVAREASLIMKSSIVVDQSGLFDSMSKEDEVIPLDFIVNNNLTDEAIETIIQTLSESKYSKDILKELGTLTINTLGSLLDEFLGYKNFSLNYSLTIEEIISEIKVALKAIKLVSDSNLLPQILSAKEVIENFIENYPKYDLDDIDIINFAVELVNSIDLDNFTLFCEALYESKIFSKTIPYIIDNLFWEVGFRFVSTEGNVLDRFYNFMDAAKILKEHQPTDFFHLIISLSDEELLWVSQIMQSVAYSKETKAFISFVLYSAFIDMDVYSIHDVFAIKNWDKEIFVLQEFCYMLYDARKNGSPNVDLIINLLKQKKDSEFASLLVDIIQQNLDYFIGFIMFGGEI